MTAGLLKIVGILLLFSLSTIAGEEKTHIALTTDLGHDLSDAFALAFIIAHPDIELDSVKMAGENAAGSYRILNRFCWLVGAYPGISWVSQGREKAAAPDPAGMFQFGLRPSRRAPGTGLRAADKPHAVTTVDLGNPTAEEKPEMSGESLEKLFATGTPLAHALSSLYELSGRQRPSLAGAHKVAEASGVEFSEADFIGQVAAYTAHNEIPNRVLNPLRNISQPVESGGFPARVHAIENFQTDIERRWWLSGRAISEDFSSNRYCRGMLTRNFDGKMGDPTRIYQAVIFNPVPGPPMGPNTRLKFRYRIEGADWLQCQVYTLSKGYHRYTTIENLPQSEWRAAVVDMTKARRPDGSGGPLSADERMDDIQFYTDPKAELFIDDIVLYDAAKEETEEPFPGEIIFTSWFDTGKRGQEWPGDFEIVPHEEPRTWKAAKSVIDPETGDPWIRAGLRGSRYGGGGFRVRFDYRLRGDGPVKVIGVNSRMRIGLELDLLGKAELDDPVTDSWATTEVVLNWPLDAIAGMRKRPLAAEMIDEIQFRVPKGSEFEIDNLLIYRRNSRTREVQ